MHTHIHTHTHTGWLNTFLTNSVKQGAIPDFLSSHLYPTDPYIPHTREGMSDAFLEAANNVSATAG